MIRPSNPRLDARYPFTKSEYVYQQIKDAILREEFAPGYRLRQEDLAQRFNTSQMPVREALRMLKAEGLVSAQSHQGAVVVDIAPRQYLDMTSVRTHLETLAVCEAAPHHTESSIKHLEDLANRMENATNGRKYSELNHQFHAAMIEPCPNELLKDLIKSQWERVWKTYSRSLFVLRPERMDIASAEHRDIIKAIRSRSASRVLAAVTAHRDHTLQAWADVLAAAEAHKSNKSSS